MPDTGQENARAMISAGPIGRRDPSAAESWLVTGASAGIGLAICQALVAQGHDVIGVARRPQADLPGDFPDIRYVTADLATAHGRAQVMANLPDRISHVLLNAGTGHYRPLEQEDPAAIRNVFDTNLLGPMALCHDLYPALQAGHGVLGLVGSVAYRGASGMPVYAASKAGLDGFGRSLRSEWHGRVDVRVIHPGPTRTGMAQRAGMVSAMALRMMLPVSDVAAGMIQAMRGTGRTRRRVSFGSVIGRRLGL